MITGEEFRNKYIAAMDTNREFRAMLYSIWHDTPALYPAEVVHGAERMWDEMENTSIFILYAYTIATKIDEIKSLKLP